MIVPMRKIYLVARQTDRKQLLAALRELGMVHLVPVDPKLAVPDEATGRQVDASSGPCRCSRAFGREALRPRSRRPRPPMRCSIFADERPRDATTWPRSTTSSNRSPSGATCDWSTSRSFARPASTCILRRSRRTPFDRIEAECVAEVGEIYPAAKCWWPWPTEPGSPACRTRPRRCACRRATRPSIRAEAKQIDEAIAPRHRSVCTNWRDWSRRCRPNWLRLEQQVEETVAVARCRGRRGPVRRAGLVARRKRAATLDEQLAEARHSGRARSDGAGRRTSNLPRWSGRPPGPGPSRGCSRCWAPCPATASSTSPFPS